MTTYASIGDVELTTHPYAHDDLRVSEPGQPEKTRRAVGLIESARLAPPKISVRKAAAAAGISEGWWRQIVAGEQKRGGHAFPVIGSDDTILAMAEAVGAGKEVRALLGRERSEEAAPPDPGGVAAPDRRTLAEIIAARLQATGWTLRQFAQEADIGLFVAGRLAAGDADTAPELQQIKSIARALGMDHRQVIVVILRDLGLPVDELFPAGEAQFSES